MRRQPQLRAVYGSQPTVCAQLHQVHARLHEHVTPETTLRSSFPVALLAHRLSVSIQSQQTKPVIKRGPVAAAVENPARCGTTLTPLTCTDALACPRCPIPWRPHGHVAPVTGCIPDRQQDGFAETLRLRESIRAPLPPVDGIVLVLQQIRARGAGKSVRHGGLLSSAQVGANRAPMKPRTAGE